jgi:hypothetical protein
MSQIDHDTQEFPVEEGESSNILEYLKELQTGEIRYLSKRSERNGGGYAVDLHKLTEIVQVRSIEDAIYLKLDSVGLRIWRLVMLKGPLEDKHV